MSWASTPVSKLEEGMTAMRGGEKGIIVRMKDGGWGFRRIGMSSATKINGNEIVKVLA